VALDGAGDVCALRRSGGRVMPRRLDEMGDEAIGAICGALSPLLIERPIMSVMAIKKASGVNIPEAQRGTVQVKLRLPPDVAEELDELAAKWGLTRSGTVARLLEKQWT